jgi:DNA-3-methyladenine glycosylase II
MTTKNPYHHINKKDKDLADIYEQFGPPPDWSRAPGFATLVHIILEQQVSLASAKAAYDKLANHIEVTPENFLTLDDTTLKSLFFSRQKTRYSRTLAQAIVSKELDLEHLHSQDDTTIRSELIKLPGIGNWTIDVYLLMALNRPDILPVGDLALQIAVKEVKGLDERPTVERLLELAKPWQPYRSYATKLLWHYYLLRSRNKKLQ